jgi:hypothetical protein
MSSIGARSAEIIVMQKSLKEKMKILEEERVRKGEVSGDHQNTKVHAISSIARNKVHPGVAHNSA